MTRSPGPITEKNIKVRIGFLMVNFIGKVFGSKIACFGNCCSLQTLTKDILKNNGTQALFLRSYESVDYAKRFLKCKVNFIPDMAFMLPSHKLSCRSRTIIVDYRPSHIDGKKSINELLCILKVFRYYGYNIEIYYQVSSDENYAIELYDKIKHMGGVRFRHKILWFNDLNYYKDKNFVISNRLHSLITGASYGVIPIARISGDFTIIKIKHILKSSFSELFNSWCGVDTNIDVANLVKNEKAIRNVLYDEMERNRNLCRETIYKYVKTIEKAE